MELSGAAAFVTFKASRDAEMALRLRLEPEGFFAARAANGFIPLQRYGIDGISSPAIRDWVGSKTPKPDSSRQARGCPVVWAGKNLACARSKCIFIQKCIWGNGSGNHPTNPRSTISISDRYQTSNYHQTLALPQKTTLDLHNVLVDPGA